MECPRKPVVVVEEAVRWDYRGDGHGFLSQWALSSNLGL